MSPETEQNNPKEHHKITLRDLPWMIGTLVLGVGGTILIGRYRNSLDDNSKNQQFQSELERRTLFDNTLKFNGISYKVEILDFQDPEKNDEMILSYADPKTQNRIVRDYLISNSGDYESRNSRSVANITEIEKTSDGSIKRSEYSVKNKDPKIKEKFKKATTEYHHIYNKAKEKITSEISSQ